MGCDIHSIYQVRQADGTWKTVAVNVFKWRSYEMFYLLVGFWHPRMIRPSYEPLAFARGLPLDLEHKTDDDSQFKDVSVEWGEGRYSLGFHSHSWFTLAEMLDFARTRVRAESALLTPDDLAEWDGCDDPSWTDDLSPLDDTGDAVVMDQAEYALKKRLGLLDDEREVLIRVWFEAQPNLDCFINGLERWQKDVSPDDVRLVIGFDS